MCPSRSAEALRGHINVPFTYKELISQKSWEIGNRKLLCYIRTIVMSEHKLTATSSAHFLTNDGSLSIIRSPVPFSYLRQLGTSDMSLKKVQVASSLDICLGKYVIIRLTAW